MLENLTIENITFEQLIPIIAAVLGLSLLFGVISLFLFKNRGRSIFDYHKKQKQSTTTTTRN